MEYKFKADNDLDVNYSEEEGEVHLIFNINGKSATAYIDTDTFRLIIDKLAEIDPVLFTPNVIIGEDGIEKRIKKLEEAVFKKPLSKTAYREN